MKRDAQTGAPLALPWLPLAGVLLLELLIYLPSLRNEFVLVDDIISLAWIRREGLSLEGILRPYFAHFMPLFRLIFALEYALFGLRSAPSYYAVCLLLHMANTVLLAAFVLRFTSSRAAAAIASFIFGLSCAYWQPVLNVLASNSGLAAACYLASALCFLKFLDRRFWPWLAAALAGQAGAFFSISYGVELPLLFYVLYVTYEEGLPLRARLRTGIRYLVIFGVGSCLLLGFRHWTMIRYETARSNSVPESPSLLIQRGFARIPIGIAYFAGGIYEGFLKSYSGAVILNPRDGLPESVEGPEFVAAPLRPFAAVEPTPPLETDAVRSAPDGESPSRVWIIQALWVFAAAVAAFFLVDWNEPRLRALRPRMFCLFVWLAVLYSIPIAYRVADGVTPRHLIPSYSFFLTESRYRYLPGLAAAALFAIPAAHLRWPGSPAPSIAGGFALACVLLVFLCCNAFDLGRKVVSTHRLSMSFAEARGRLISDIERHLAGTPGVLPLSRVPFYREMVSSRYLLKNEDILDAYLSAPLRERIVFVTYQGKPVGGSSAGVPFDTFFRITPDGHLESVSRPKP